MYNSTSKKNLLLKGTFILTLTGFLSRLIGFFYRIFLCRAFGEEGMGLYQLIFPIYALCYSFTVAGIETALSRSVAEKVSLGKPQVAKQLLYGALGISILLSCLVTCFLQANASVVATVILGDIRCEPLLMAMSYSFPFAAIHSCICGYYFGFKQTGIPASSQLIEQLLRVATVYGLYLFAIHHSLKLNITIAVLGLVFGEIASAAFCMQAFTAQHKKTDREKNSFRTCFFQLKTLLPLSIPLTANRILLNLLQSVEAISIPARLQLYGLTSSEALSMYGVLTGMALPCILFPSAITNSVSTMMLPTVAEIQAADHPLRLIALIKKVTGCCFLLGTGCCLFFLFAGHFMGKVLFQSPLAGQFIFILAFICPFQYTNSTLLSILNGLGKTSSSFGITSIGLLLRILSVFFLIPMVGILGYLWGLLASQLVVSVLCLGSLKHHLVIRKPSSFYF